MVMVLIGTSYYRQLWEVWDIRVLVLYSFAAQAYLIFVGRYRKSTALPSTRLLVWVSYLMAELVATIALGKLSDVGSDHKRFDVFPTDVLRILWAPCLLFFLGGPDTITVLAWEENQMWLRHLIGLIIQGLRTGYSIFLAWNGSTISVMSLLVLCSGIINYGERVWVVSSTVQLRNLPSADQVNSYIHDSKLLLQAYYHFQILKPHVTGYICNKHSLDNLMKDFSKQVREDTADNTFKIIEIELGLMHDVLFTKMGTIFTKIGCILRSISISLLVYVCLWFWLAEKQYKYSFPDRVVTYILLFGTLSLETCGIIVQLFSDWAMLWAIKHQQNWFLTPILPLFRGISMVKAKRWSNRMGQFHLLGFCIAKHNTLIKNQFGIAMTRTKLNKMIQNVFGIDLKLYHDAYSLKVPGHLRELIIQQLIERTQDASQVDPLSLVRNRGEWTLERYSLQHLKWSINELEFDESIVIWHIATDVCYYSEESNNRTQMKSTARLLSSYMLYLLVIRTSRLPISDRDEIFVQACSDVMKIFEGKGVLTSHADAYKMFLEQRHDDSGNLTVKYVRELASSLMERENRWEIISNVWVEILCYTAGRCPMKYHAQWVRHGGQLLTHVWLLLLHFGVTTKPQRRPYSGNLEGLAESAIKGLTELMTS